MKIHYQVATPEVTKSPNVTSMQGDIYENIDKLKRYGYDGLELMVRDTNLIDQERIISYIKDKDMNISMICTGEVYGEDGLTLTSSKKEIREEAVKRLKKLIDFAEKCNANLNIGRVRGFYCEELSENETEEFAINSLRELCEYAEDKGVSILMEPVTRLQTNFINSTKDGIEFCRKVKKDNFKLMLDIYHMNIEDPCILKSLKEARDYVKHVHFADNNRRILGNCGMDFKNILKTLKEIGYEGVISLEIFQIPNQDVAAKKSIEYLKAIMEE